MIELLLLLVLSHRAPRWVLTRHLLVRVLKLLLLNLLLMLHLLMLSLLMLLMLSGYPLLAGLRIP
jgi:hypothetical protein